MENLAVCIDGNYLLYKDVFILNKTRSMESDLMTLLNNDINKINRVFNFNRIYFISDMGKSWRRDIYGDYKGNREKDKKIDWNFVFKEYDTFKDVLKNDRSIKFHQYEELEGDDIIAHVVNKLNSKGISVLIIAADKDLHQLIKYDIEKQYINIMWNFKFNNQFLYIPKNHEIFINHVENLKPDIFSSNINMEFLAFWNDFIFNKNIKRKEVDAEMSLFCKILSGDSGDNIDSVYKQKMKNSDKYRGIGESGAEKIYETYKKLYPEDINFLDPIFIKNATDVVAYSKKITDDKIKDSIKGKISRNLMLVNLDPAFLPKRLYEIMDTEIESKQKKIVEKKDDVDDFWEN